jgi:hypothetical protein
MAGLAALFSKLSEVRAALARDEQLTFGELAKQVRSGKLKDANKLSAELDRIHATPQSLLAEIERLDAVDEARKQLRDTDALHKKHTELVEGRQAAIAKFDAARKEHDATLTRLATEEALLVRDWAMHNDAERRLSELLSADDQSEVSDLDNQLAAKNGYRESLRAKCGSGSYWQEWGGGDRHPTYATRIKELQDQIKKAEYDHAKTADPDRRQKLKDLVRDSEAAIKRIGKELSADRQTICELDGEIGMLTARRDMALDRTMRG